MRCISDIDRNEKDIRRSIKRYASSVEHHFAHWRHLSRKDRPNYFFDFGNEKGMLARCHERCNQWHVLGNPLAERAEWTSMMAKFLDHVFGKRDAAKVWLEVPADFRQEIAELLRRSNKYRACRLNFILHWPLFDMERWDSQLEGKEWKKMRNIVNRFRGFKIEDPRKLDEKNLLGLFEKWKACRINGDSIDSGYYRSVIKSNFEGMDICRSVIVDGKPKSITCGWFLPGLNVYYSSIGIYDYDVPYLGEFCNMDDLMNLKKAGYKTVDFGGSDEFLLDFKKKFRFHRTYNTYIFSIVKK